MTLILVKPKRNKPFYALYDDRVRDVVCYGTRPEVSACYTRVTGRAAGMSARFRQADLAGTDSAENLYAWHTRAVPIGADGRLLRQYLAKYGRLLQRGLRDQARRLLVASAHAGPDL